MSVKVEFRAEPHQKLAWAAAAASDGLKFSQWARRALDAALAGADVGGGTTEALSSVPASVPASAERAIPLQPHPRVTPKEPPADPERVTRPPSSGLPALAPNCRDAGLHWRIQPGQMCKWCQGYVPQ